MPRFPYAPNAIWWVQFHLLGGPARLIPFIVIYAAVLVSAAIGCRYFFPSTPVSAYCDGVVMILTAVQVVLIIVGGCNAVFRALKRDIDTRMLESHRVSPISSTAAMVGYIVGANIQVLLMYTVGVIAGVVIVRWGTIGDGKWLAGNLYMLALALMAWSATALLSLCGKKPTSPNAVLFLLLICSMGVISIPGVGLITGAYAAVVGARLMAGNTTVPPYAAALLVLITTVMMVVWARASMRKFRRPDLPAFGVGRALGLFGIWLLVSHLSLLVLETGAVEDLGALNVELGPDFASIALTVTGAASLLFAILPIVSAADARCRHRSAPDGRRRDFRTWPFVVPLLCAGMLTAVAVPFVQRSASWSLVGAFVGMWASLVVVEGLSVSARARNRRSSVALAIYVILFWLAPAVGDFVMADLREVEYGLGQPQFSAVLGASPMGSLANAHFDIGVNPWPGVTFQVLIGALGGAFGVWAVRRLRRRELAIPDHKSL